MPQSCPHGLDGGRVWRFPVLCLMQRRAQTAAFSRKQDGQDLQYVKHSLFGYPYESKQG